MKNNTNTSFDRINNEMLKQSSLRLQECITKFFNIILAQGKYPSSWRENILKPLHKKGSDTDPNNYRGIVVSSCLSKLFSKILYNRIDDHVKLPNLINENQAGFRKHYRTSDHILTPRSVVEKAFKKNFIFVYMFCGFKKSF